jgi:hypothetical protein
MPMDAKKLFKMMSGAERTHLLCVTAYIVNMSQDTNEVVETLQAQLKLTTTRYATFSAELKQLKPKTIKFLASAYNFADATIKNYLRGKKRND